MTAIRTVAVLNNAISSELTRRDMAARGIDLADVALILLRDCYEPWMAGCGTVLRYPGKPARHMWQQGRFLRFFRRAARLLRRIDDQDTLHNIYVVNNDNLISAHLLGLADRRPSMSMSVVAEGLMNFQDIGIANRAGWRWRVKPLIARALGYRYRAPAGHLSGAFEPRVDRVVSFAAEGLKAPSEKIVIVPFAHVEPMRRPDPSVALVALTGLNEWMTADAFAPFAHSFDRWLRGMGFRKIQVKRHPRVSAGLIETLLADAEPVGGGQSLEAIAPAIEAGVIIGTCCTALVTLKLIRPDLRCIDFGSDYYAEHAYHGDDSVKRLFEAVGVELVQMESDPSATDIAA